MELELTPIPLYSRVGSRAFKNPSQRMWHCEMTLILFQTLYLESLEAKEDNGQEVVEG